MDFKDINQDDIINFLKLNNIIPHNDLHNTAIELINNVNIDIKFTTKIENWLTAYSIKHKIIDPINIAQLNNLTDTDLLYYQNIFELEYIDIVIIKDVLTFLHLINDKIEKKNNVKEEEIDVKEEKEVSINTPDVKEIINDTTDIKEVMVDICNKNIYVKPELYTIPEEIIAEIIIYFHLSELQVFKQICKTIYKIYNNIIVDKFFLQKLYKQILYNKSYSDDCGYDIDTLAEIRNETPYMIKCQLFKQLKNVCIKLSPIPGHVSYVTKSFEEIDIKSIKLPELIVNIFICKKKTFFLGKSNKLYVLYYTDVSIRDIADLPIPVTDIIDFHGQYIVLSNGMAYYGDIKILNMYSHEGRSYNPLSMNTNLTLIDNIDNIINMYLDIEQDNMLFHTLQGDVYTWTKPDTFKKLISGVKQIIYKQNKYYTVLHHSAENNYYISGLINYIKIKDIDFKTNIMPTLSFSNDYINGALCGDHFILIDDKQLLYNTTPVSYILQKEDIDHVIKVIGCDTKYSNIDKPYNYYVITKP